MKAKGEDGGAKCSASVTRHETGANYGKVKSKGAVKKKHKTLDVENIFSKAPFIDYLETIKAEKGITAMSEEQFWIKQRQILQMLLNEGSELKLKELNRKAVEKYKVALGMILQHSLKIYRLTELDFIVLKYSLSTCLVELAAYSDIIKGIEYLTEIQKNAKIFPAVYYGLAKAYKQLNRFNAAVKYLENGISFLNREVKFETQSWPETHVVIPETTREGLEDLIDKMLKECTAYHEPDAICKYSKCRDISSHILPSEHMFFSDPEFAGYVIISCEEKCRVEYHLTCWKDYKEKSTDEIGRHSDKEFIGRNCPTPDCVSQPNIPSIINKIQIIDGDGSVKSTEISAIVKEKILSKKKKPDVVVPQAKTKPLKKVKKPLEVVKPVVLQESPPDNTAKELEERLEKLNIPRDLNFGSLQESNVIDELSRSKDELEKEGNKMKLQKADEATALKETIAQKGKEIETLKKKLSVEKAACEELKNRISEIISETGKKSNLLKAYEEGRCQLKAAFIKATLQKENMKVNRTQAPNATSVGVNTASAPNSYGRLMKHLHHHFPTRTEEELNECVTLARQRNNNSLSDLKVTTIISMIDKIFKEKAAKKQGR